MSRAKQLNYPKLYANGLPEGRWGRDARLEDSVVRRIFKATGDLEACRKAGSVWSSRYVEILRDVREKHDRHFVGLDDFDKYYPGWPMTLSTKIVPEAYKLDLWDALRPRGDAQTLLANLYRRERDDAFDHGRVVRTNSRGKPSYGLVFPIYNRTKYVLHNDRSGLLAGRRDSVIAWRGLFLETLENYLGQVTERWLFLLDEDETLAFEE